MLSDEYGCIIGGEGGIRTHVGVSPNRFRVGAGLATSVPLRGSHRISVMRDHNTPCSTFADQPPMPTAPPTKPRVSSRNLFGVGLRRRRHRLFSQSEAPRLEEGR